MMRNGSIGLSGPAGGEGASASPGHDAVLTTAIRELIPRRDLVVAPAPLQAYGDEAADFTVHCFGEFRLLRHGRRVVLPRASKTAAILRYLVLRRSRPVARETLLELIWPDEQPGAAAASLNTTLSVLRKALAAELGAEPGGGSIVYSDGAYTLNPALRLHVDVAEFDAWCARGLASEQACYPEDAVGAYRAAIALYTGELAIGDSYDSWLLIERERLAGAYFLIAHKLALHCLERGLYTEAMAQAQQMLAHDPCREEAHGTLMRCFARLDQRTQALRQFELCCALLRRDLGVKPVPELLALREQLAAGQPI